jgi:hypothetical protein
MTIPRDAVRQKKTLSVAVVATKVQEALDLATLNLSFALPPVLSFNVACITAMAYNTSHTHTGALHHGTNSKAAWIYSS